jgi:hypothetical protein
MTGAECRVNFVFDKGQLRELHDQFGFPSAARTALQFSSGTATFASIINQSREQRAEQHNSAECSISSATRQDLVSTCRGREREAPRTPIYNIINSITYALRNSQLATSN